MASGTTQSAVGPRVRSAVLLVAACLWLPACSGCGGSGGSTGTDAGPIDSGGCSSLSTSCAATLAAGSAATASTSAVLEVKWSYDPGLVVYEPIVLATHGLVAVRTGLNRVGLLELSTGTLSRSLYGDDAEALATSLSADEDENLYFVGNRVYSRTPGDTKRWTAELDGPFPSGGDGPGVARAPALGSGLATLAGTDGRIYALSMTDGSRRWSIEAPVESSETRVVGRADTVLIPSLGEGVLAVNAATGEKRWRAGKCPHLPFTSAIFPVRAGFVAGEYELRSGGAPRDRFVSFAVNSCGEDTATLPGFEVNVLEAPDGRILTASSDVLVTAVEYRMIDVATGQRSSPLTLGGATNTTTSFRFDLVAVGADNFGYVMESYDAVPTGGQPVRARLFRIALTDMTVDGPPLELGVGQGAGMSSAMDAQGVLYISLRTRVVAVRTPSPGPALGRWSVRNGDMHGSLWLN